MNKAQLEAMLKTHCGKSPEFCTDKELYTGLLSLVQTLARKGESGKGKKKALLHFRRISYRKASIQQPDQLKDI